MLTLVLALLAAAGVPAGRADAPAPALEPTVWRPFALASGEPAERLVLLPPARPPPARLSSAVQPSALPAAVPPSAAPPAAPIPVLGPARASANGIVLELHSDFGFSRLVQIEFTDGRRATLSLNDGISFALGWSFLSLADGRLGTRASVGFKFDRLRASNGSAFFTAFPVDLMEAIYAGPLRLGAGASVLLAPRVGGSGFLDGARASFEPAPGAVLDAEWLVSSRGRAGIGVRASWYRFASSTFVRGAPSLGLVLRADLDVAGQ